MNELGTMIAIFFGGWILMTILLGPDNWAGEVVDHRAKSSAYFERVRR